MSKTKKPAKKGPTGRLPVARKSAGGGGVERAGIPLWSNYGKALEDLPELASQIRALDTKKKAIQEEIDSLNIAVKGLMESVNDRNSWSVRDIDSDWVAVYVRPGPRKKIVPELLIQQGVTVKQIEKATKETPSKPYVSVRGRNEKYENKGEE